MKPGRSEPLEGGRVELTFYVSPKEEARLRKLAKKRGFSLSATVRSEMLAVADAEGIK